MFLSAYMIIVLRCEVYQCFLAPIKQDLEGALSSLFPIPSRSLLSFPSVNTRNNQIITTDSRPVARSAVLLVIPFISSLPHLLLPQHPRISIHPLSGSAASLTSSCLQQAVFMSQSHVLLDSTVTNNGTTSVIRIASM